MNWTLKTCWGSALCPQMKIALHVANNSWHLWLWPPLVILSPNSTVRPQTLFISCFFQWQSQNSTNWLFMTWWIFPPQGPALPMCDPSKRWPSLVCWCGNGSVGQCCWLSPPTANEVCFSVYLYERTTCFRGQDNCDLLFHFSFFASVPWWNTHTNACI
jgi:hypothetical protein